LGWNLQSGKPYTPLATVVVDEITEEEEDYLIAYAMLGEINANRLPTYHRLDLSAVYDFPAPKNNGATYQLGVSIINVYNQNNLVEKRFLDGVFDLGEEAEANVDLFEKTLLPFTPNLFFRVEWE
ncbi:MAG: hypothetical protein AAF840_18025, partial [Bacteroidota bacterium]